MMSQQSVSKAQLRPQQISTVETFKGSTTATEKDKVGSLSLHLDGLALESAEKNDSAFNGVTEWQFANETERSEVDQSFVILRDPPVKDNEGSLSIIEQQVLQQTKLITFSNEP